MMGSENQVQPTMWSAAGLALDESHQRVYKRTRRLLKLASFVDVVAVCVSVSVSASCS